MEKPSPRSLNTLYLSAMIKEQLKNDHEESKHLIIRTSDVDDNDDDNSNSSNNSSSSNDSPQDLYLRWSSEASSQQSFSFDEEDGTIVTDKCNNRTKKQENEGNNKKSDDKSCLHCLWTYCWLPDGPWNIGNVHLLDAEGVKLFKFFIISVLCLLWIHYYAFFMNADRDETYSIREMILFDGNHIALDIVVFFVVGRLYEQPSVDSLGWILPVVLSAMALSSVATHSKSLHHSITPYEIKCSWGWEMWTLIIGGALPVIVLLVSSHFVHAYRSGYGMVRKSFELGMTLTIFLLPYSSSSFFHLHHWYYAWMLGMHANANVWWSRLTMGVMWGIYINGVGIYGRDPIMTCAVTLYQSQNNLCPYLVSDNYTLAELRASAVADWTECL